MENIHPETEQLASYMESPEAGEHRKIRSHLMACANCRSRIDRMSQLELDIKHYVPRFSAITRLPEDNEQIIERYIDGELTGTQKNNTQLQIDENKDALKAALHYAAHSAAMSKNIDSTNIDTSNKAKTVSNHSMIPSPNFLQRMLQSLQLPTPAWVMAPASLAIAAIISYTLITTSGIYSTQPSRIAAFQDDPTITFQQRGAPAGSIGFFHSAQTKSQAFTGIDIRTGNNDGLTFNWQPINNATEYNLEIFLFKNGEKVAVSQKTSSTPNMTFNNIDLLDGGHYQWLLSGTTNDGLGFQTEGDFIYYRSDNS